MLFWVRSIWNFGDFSKSFRYLSKSWLFLLSACLSICLAVSVYLSVSPSLVYVECPLPAMPRVFATLSPSLSLSLPPSLCLSLYGCCAASRVAGVDATELASAASSSSPWHCRSDFVRFSCNVGSRCCRGCCFSLSAPLLHKRISL